MQGNFCEQGRHPPRYHPDPRLLDTIELDHLSLVGVEDVQFVEIAEVDLAVTVNPNFETLQ